MSGTDRKRILILGAGFLQGVAIRSAKSKGWEVIAVDGNPRAVCAPEADRFEPIDLKDREALKAFALELKSGGGLQGVFTAATDFSASVAAVAEACSLPGHSLESALNASDKVRMRKRFAEAGIPSPKFAGIRVADLSRAQEMVRDAGIAFPLVVKPADNMGARGCVTVREKGELLPALTEGIANSRTGTAIVEEYMEGPEFSIEALVFDGKVYLTGLADRHICFPPRFIEMGHTMPTNVPEGDARRIFDVFVQGIRALGLSHGAAKGDIKLTPGGVMVGEIAGRLSGGYMSGWTFPYASGIDLTSAALDLAVGIRPRSLEPTAHLVAAERAWISAPGRVFKVSGLEAARATPFVRDLFPRSFEGDSVVFPRNNVEKCGNVLAVADTREAAVEAAERACREIVLRLEPRRAETDAFIDETLKNPGLFPPAAFACSPVSGPLGGYVTLRIPDNREVFLPAQLVPPGKTLRDWQGRTVQEALAQALDLEPSMEESLSPASSVEASLRDRYWKGFMAAGIQGLLYVHDSIS